MASINLFVCVYGEPITAQLMQTFRRQKPNAIVLETVSKDNKTLIIYKVKHEKDS